MKYGKKRTRNALTLQALDLRSGFAECYNAQKEYCAKGGYHYVTRDKEMLVMQVKLLFKHTIVANLNNFVNLPYFRELRQFFERKGEKANPAIQIARLNNLQRFSLLSLTRCS